VEPLWYIDADTLGLAHVLARARPDVTYPGDNGVRHKKIWRDHGLVITTRRGTPYEPRNFTRHFAARCDTAGVRYITPHGVRRTCASLLAALDVHPRVAMRILRHSKITVTMEIYTEVPDQAARDALRRLGEQFDS
jgi:integrase